MRRFGIALIVLALALPVFAQQQPFAEEIDVNAVLLDVIVTDATGKQILGLAPGDFVVKENGVEQTLESVDYFTNRKLLDAREENAPFKVERVREDRYFIFFFDKPSDPSTLFSDLALAREAVRDFVRNEMKENDRVAIAGHDFRLKIYSDFTADKKQLEKALNEATRFGRGLSKAPAEEGPSILRNANAKQIVNETGTVYEALDLLADSVKPIRARKNLVLFSPGIADQHERQQQAGMLTSRSPHLDPMLESLNAANVTAYTVQLDRNAAATQLFHQRLSEIASSTGGHYFQLVTSFNPIIERVENVNSGYYLLSYRSRHPKGEKGFQKVDVSVRNPEFRVQSRSGYQFGG